MISVWDNVRRCRRTIDAQKNGRGPTSQVNEKALGRQRVNFNCLYFKCFLWYHIALHVQYSHHSYIFCLGSLTQLLIHFQIAKQSKT